MALVRPRRKHLIRFGNYFMWEAHYVRRRPACNAMRSIAGRSRRVAPLLPTLKFLCIKLTMTNAHRHVIVYLLVLDSILGLKGLAAYDAHKQRIHVN